MSDQVEVVPSGFQRIVDHLIELRRRLLICVASLVVVFLVLFYFATPLFNLLASPLLQQLGHQQTMVATSLTSTFVAPIKFSFFIALCVTMPVIFYHLWAFVAPALYPNERRHIWPLLLMSSLLFYLGVLFAYKVVFPLLFKFFISMAPDSITVMPDIASYVDLILKLFFAFGLTFEVPIFTLLLIMSGVVSVKGLKQKRPYVIVGAFTLGMLLTPPDVLSQILLAIPLYFLFECGIVAGSFVEKRRHQQDVEPAL